MDMLTDPRTPLRKPLAPIAPMARPAACDGIGLVLQGGGALGAYQAGVYQALHEANFEPDWIAGVSIGSINAAIIAGNKPEDRLEKLEKFWLDITARDPFTLWPEGDNPRKLRNILSALNGMVFGQPGFFQPATVNAWLAPRGARGATALYDSSPLHKTLENLVDFDLINSRTPRFAVGAVDVATANFLYFDNTQVEIGPEHIMASGALPPALPMVRIGKHYYWDGGLVSNTPLQHLLDNCGSMNLLVFQVDLFSASGDVPRDMPDVLSRQKDIQYSSRTRTTTDHFLQTHRLKQALRDALSLLPYERLTDAQTALKVELERLPEINIMQLIYQQKAYEGGAKDYEFSRLSMKDHWRSGYYDTRNTLAHSEWLEMKGTGGGIHTHDIHSTGE
ncbi:membrane protein [Acidocella aquatica]|uniref:Membrane protein n=1 Tax=Acidocella aquatica TaxID=1922313 RepID=A0ABQ6A6N3_9PROT|nr:patatin-like phospholipase family protein [Acidocella aquatica]GLR68110.1 membrane protein [Acidocella aquatica]